MRSVPSKKTGGTEVAEDKENRPGVVSSGAASGYVDGYTSTTRIIRRNEDAVQGLAEIALLRGTFAQAELEDSTVIVLADLMMSEHIANGDVLPDGCRILQRHSDGRSVCVVQLAGRWSA